MRRLLRPQMTTSWQAAPTLAATASTAFSIAPMPSPPPVRHAVSPLVVYQQVETLLLLYTDIGQHPEVQVNSFPSLPAAMAATASPACLMAPMPSPPTYKAAASQAC